jgi:hypothetical protein
MKLAKHVHIDRQSIIANCQLLNLVGGHKGNICTVLSTFLFKKKILSRYLWLTPVILATREAEIRRVVVQVQPGKIV